MDIIYVNVGLSSVVINASLCSKRENSLEKEKERERDFVLKSKFKKKKSALPISLRIYK